MSQTATEAAGTPKLQGNVHECPIAPRKPERQIRAAFWARFLTGTQALVRLLLLQHQRDVVAGLNTGGLVSGYRGSPLGSVDQAPFSAKSHLSKSGVAFQPRINENLAATAVWGTQQVYLRPGAKVDGVYAMWYGKGPGVDRSGDGETADGGDTTERNHAGRPAGDDSWFWSRQIAFNCNLQQPTR